MIAAPAFAVGADPAGPFARRFISAFGDGVRQVTFFLRPLVRRQRFAVDLQQFLVRRAKDQPYAIGLGALTDMIAFQTLMHVARGHSPRPPSPP